MNGNPYICNGFAHRFLSRDMIKLLACVTMLTNHIASIFLQPADPGYDIMISIGYFTAVTMCYFLVEGYDYTSSKKRYALRLLFFALISQIPYHLAFRNQNLNMLFTLLLCFLVLEAKEKILRPDFRILSVFLLLLLSGFCDWAYLAVCFTWILDETKHGRMSPLRAWVICYVLYLLTEDYSVFTLFTLSRAVLSGLPILLSGFVIQFFYNGKRAIHGRTFCQWFFYFFYPGHLVLLILIRKVLQETLI